MKTTRSVLTVLAFATGVFVCSGSLVLAVDCQPNGLDDECDLDCAAQAGACNVGGCGQSADCQPNGVPDECDIAGAASADCNANTVPDECESVDWVGGGGDDNWSTDANWSPVGAPNDCAQRVTISGVFTVDLNMDADMYSLVMENGAILNVTAAGAGDLTIGAGGLDLRGVLNVENDHTINVSTGHVTIGPNGVYQPGAGATDGEISLLQAASITILKGDPPGKMVVEFDMRVECLGDFEMNGIAAASGTGPSSTQSDTPPILLLRPRVFVGIDGNLLLQGSATVDINGRLCLRESATVQIGAPGGGLLSSPAAASRAGTGARILLAGDFVNNSTAPELFDANNGTIVLDGAGPQTYEVAGVVPSTAGEVFDNNFAFGSIEMAPGSDVTTQNLFANMDAGVQEALFVGSLTLESQATITVRDSGVFFGTQVNRGGTTRLKDGGVFQSIASLFPQFSPVPTTSQWGVIVATLALLTAGTIAIRRRRRAAA